MTGVPGASVFVDVNVPMYAAGQPHTYRESCVWLMKEIAAGAISVAIDTEIIQEILYRYGALQRWQIAATMATSLLDMIPTIYAVRPNDVRLAITLFERYAPLGVTARDIIHIAVMKHNGLTEIVSTDEHFDAIEGLTRLDPRTLFEQAHS